jgi:hypothetical protein
VPLITICFGILLVPLGLVVFVITATDRYHFTSLIPTAMGLVLIVLGALAYKPNLRKHAMHAAAVVGLLGVIGPAIRAVPGLLTYLSSGEVKSMPALVGTSLTMVLSLVFLGLCVNSFIQARKRRQAGQTPA